MKKMKIFKFKLNKKIKNKIIQIQLVAQWQQLKTTTVLLIAQIYKKFKRQNLKLIQVKLDMKITLQKIQKMSYGLPEKKLHQRYFQINCLLLLAV